MDESTLLTDFKEKFELTFQISKDKEAYVKMFIEGLSLIFDEKKLDVSLKSWTDYPLEEFLIYYSSAQIYLIRQFRKFAVITGHDISESEGWMVEFKDLMNSEPFLPIEISPPIYNYYRAHALNEFLKWLRRRSKTKSEYPDKYYAWYHKIRIALGKAAQFTPGARQEIINYGKNEYGTKGHGFYQAFLDFDLNDKSRFVNSLIPKDKGKWKIIIKKISQDDKDVINYLKKYPN